MSDGLFFYFMKVGAGNQFIEFPEHLGALEKRKGLFVGYHGRDIPEVNTEGEFQGPLDDKELRSIALASRKALQARSIACVFTESHLTLWEITGYLGAIPPEEVRHFAKIPYKDLDLALDYDRDWRAATAAAAGGQINVKAFFQGYHWLPARLFHAVPRYELMAPVDSLRVHRWLNSGTFRSLHSIKGNGLMDRVEMLNSLTPLDHHSIRSRTSETAYAKLVRQYLTGLIRPSARVALDDRQVSELASLWINPAQLETVGALLALDLGFTLEVGLGKGQDVVDIKASLGHLEGVEKKAVSRSVLDRLERVLKVSMTRAFRERITEHGIFWVQCKAQDRDDKPTKKMGIENEGEDWALRGDGPNPDLVLTLMPGAAQSPNAPAGRLYLSRLMECVAAQPKSYPHLNNWQHVYTKQIRQGMCVSGSRV